MSQTTSHSRLSTRTLAAIVLAASALAACGSSSSGGSTTVAVSPRVVVTSVKGDPRSELLAAIYARALENAGFRVGRKDPVAMDRAAYYAALQSGQFQLIPDSTLDLQHFVFSQPGAGTAPTTVVPSGPATTQAPITIPTTTTTVADTSGASTTTAAPTTTVPASTTTVPVISNGRTATEQVVAIKSELPTTLTVNDGSLAEDKTVVACTPATMTANAHNQLVTLTDLASIAPNIRLGGSAAWMADQEAGYPELQNTYGGDFKSTVTVEDAGLAAAIDAGTADCFAMNSLNPVITTKKLVILSDDKVMVANNSMIALVSSSVGTPDLIAALDSVNTALTTERLNQMLNEIATNHTDPATVAAAFMATV